MLSFPLLSFFGSGIRETKFSVLELTSWQASCTVLWKNYQLPIIRIRVPDGLHPFHNVQDYIVKFGFTVHRMRLEYLSIQTALIYSLQTSRNILQAAINPENLKKGNFPGGCTFKARAFQTLGTNLLANYSTALVKWQLKKYYKTLKGPEWKICSKASHLKSFASIGKLRRQWPRQSRWHN